MKKRYGNMWAAPGVHVVTTNSYINAAGELVMGRGAAKEATLIHPGVQHIAGRLILYRCGRGGVYGFIPPEETMPIGLFQVKRHFKSKAELSIISASAAMLCEWAAGIKRSIHLNYPGIGNGGLDIEVVEPLLEELPDNVYVWRYAVPSRD